jgi:hypothetical protein
VNISQDLWKLILSSTTPPIIGATIIPKCNVQLITALTLSIIMLLFLTFNLSSTAFIVSASNGTN